RWLLFDTWTQNQRDLPGRPLGGGRESFSPDERLLLVQGADSIILLRTADGTVERTISVTGPLTWSPAGELRTIAGAMGQPQWAPDGAWYLLGNRDVVEARAAADDRTLWQVRADLLPGGGTVTLGHGTARYGVIAPDGSLVAI